MSDAKFLQDQAEAAKDAMGRAWSEFMTGMGKSADPRQWAKAHPWITMASATVAGFAAASTLVPSKEEQALKKLAAIERALHIDGRPRTESNGNGAKEPKESFVTRLIKEAFAAAGPVLANILSAQMKPPPAPQQASDAGPPPSTQAGAGGRYM